MARDHWLVDQVLFGIFINSIAVFVKFTERYLVELIGSKGKVNRFVIDLNTGLLIKKKK